MTLSAQITFPSGSPVSGGVTFDMADGVDMGDYIAPTAGFTQRCVRVRNPALPNFFVDFRPDVTRDRAEVVFWNGECDPINQTVPSHHIRDLPGYQVKIIIDGIAVSTTTPPHYWGTRWRFQSEPRPIIRTAAQVFADGFFPAMSKAAARLDRTGVIKPVPMAAVGTYTPFMGPDADRPTYKLGLDRGVETGGERPELGPMSEWPAQYLLTGDPDCLNAVIQHAEMSSSEWPFFLSDLGTGAALNFKSDLAHYRTYIDGTAYDDYYHAAFTPYANQWDFHEQDSHFQMHPYIAYALTEDPYFLEGIQYIQAYGMGNRATMYARENVYGNTRDGMGINGLYTNCSHYREIRTIGNGIRNLAMAYKAAPENPPAWILKKDYYAALSQDFSAVINKLWMTNPAPLHRIFRQISYDNSFQAFEQAYAINGEVIADLVGMPTGTNPTWFDILDWSYGMFDALLNGTSGWNRQVPQPHDIVNNATTIDPPTGNLDFSKYTDPKTAWARLYADCEVYLKRNATLPNAPFPGNQQGGSMGNFSMMRMATAGAASRGVPAAIKNLPFCDLFIDTNYPNNADASMGIAFEAKCGFTGELAVPAPAPDETPPTPPTEIDMPTSFAIRVGQTKQLNVAAVPPDAELASLTYRAVPSGIVALTPNETGVQVIGLKVGTVQVFADASGEDANGNPVPIEAESDGTVSRPLATGLTLTPAS